MLTSRQSTLNVTKTVSPITQAKQVEAASRKEVQLILENLFEREEATVKLVIDCLFDMGVVYLVNQKIPTPIVNPLVKRVANISKSGIRIIAFRFVMKKFVLSGFLTNFLVNKVKGIIGINTTVAQQKNKQVSPQSEATTSLPSEKEATPIASKTPVNSQKEQPSVRQIASHSSQKTDSESASYPQLTPESQQVLNHHIQGIAKVIYQESNSQQVTLAQVEEIIRQQTVKSMRHTASLVTSSKTPQKVS
ncbi:MAG: hypothetical protein AB4058_02050 [Microcystaceae cyanobacterium]